MWSFGVMIFELMYGKLPPAEQRGFGQMDKTLRLPKRREPNDPSVVALREHLRANNG